MASRDTTSFWRSLRNIATMTDSRARHQIWVLVLLTLASALSEVFTIATIVPFLALLAGGSAGARRRWLDPVLHAVGADSSEKALIAATVALACAAIASAAVRILLQRKTQDFVYSFGHRLSIEVQRRALLQPYSWHVRQNSSQQLANIEKVELVTGMVLFPLVQAAAATTITGLIVVLLLRLAPLPTLGAVVVVGVIYYALALSARRRLETYSEEIERSFEERIRVLQEGLAGIRDIILDSSQALLLDRFRAVDLRLARARATATFVSAVPRYVVEAAGIITIAVLALALSRREGGLATALPVLGAVALGAQRVLPLIQQLYQGWSSVLGNRAVVDELSRQLALAIPETSPPRSRLPFKKAIQFTGVGYAYADRSRHAVTGLTFTIPHGARVALVGPTGSGKSTTADLLMGLLEPTEGSIAVDGVELTDANRESWRANVSHVPQILFLADATIAQNIALSGKVDMDRVREATALAQLDEFVASLPDGFDTVVGERGERISGGQRQRLAIARAIYRDTPLLVLDEATSALDDDTETAVLEALVKLQKQDRTIIIIAHRSRLIAECDCLIRLDKGRVVELARGAALPLKKRRA